MANWKRTDEQRIAEFWSSIDQSGGPDACWEWTKKLNPGGYGGSYIFGMKGAHRVAHYLAHGDPGSLHVLHSCDNRACCNPAHLSAGTPKKNMQEMVERGRHASGPNSPNTVNRKMVYRRELEAIAAGSKDGQWVMRPFNDAQLILFGAKLIAHQRRTDANGNQVNVFRITRAGTLALAKEFKTGRSLSYRIVNSERPRYASADDAMRDATASLVRLIRSVQS